MFKKVKIIVLFSLITVFTGCSNNSNKKETIQQSQQEDNKMIILKNDNSNEERNKLLTADIQYFAAEFPKLHKNPFSILSKDEFYQKTNNLVKKIDKLNNQEVFVELNKIIVSVSDAHTSINYWDGYSYPLKFWIFGNDVYIVNADKSLENMMFSKVVKINDTSIDKVTKELSTLISHENESWIKAILPQYLETPVYMYGLGIVPDEQKTIFTVEKDGKTEEHQVSTLKFGQQADFIRKEMNDVFIGKYVNNYDYTYLTDDNALYFIYNACAEMKNESFEDFNKRMFKTVNTNKVYKIIVDLRNNSGGNSEILNPFTTELKKYLNENPNVKVYVLVGRNTFSSGMFAIYRTIEAAPNFVSIGEPTGGAIDCYGEVKQTKLPNSGIPINYSIKYFEFSKQFSYKNQGVKTFIPGIILQPSFEDYKSGNDIILKYALEH